MSEPARQALKEMIRMKHSLNELLSHHTGQPIERIRTDTDRDYFMSSKESKEYGLIDKVIDKRP